MKAFENSAPRIQRVSFLNRLKWILIGPPRDLADPSLYRHLSLIAFLAWVGLGADGLSSSAYGPEEAFRTLGSHTYLAIALAFVMAATVIIISVAYSRVIEHFPHGGGGYVVATKLLGKKAGLVSGSALLVDYVLTIAISLAAAGDALFSFLPLEWQPVKLYVEIALTVFLLLLNLRGVRESVLALMPVFVLFLITHAILVLGGIAVSAPQLPETLSTARTGFSQGLSTLGAGGLFLLFIRAFSLGGGTYTGIEAVSNGLGIMREPRVHTGKRTMLYMALSLAITASGLLLCYLLWHLVPVEGKTMNAVLVEKLVGTVPFGKTFIILTLVSEGAILVVAAQAGFVDGPRVLGNMALDSWVPRRFAAFSERLTTQNGILLMGLTSLAALLYTRGNVGRLVVMYSINVFITFSMTETAMCRMYFGSRKKNRGWIKKIWIHLTGLCLCLTILTITIYEKFLEGGWVTLAVTGLVIALCGAIRRHYNGVSAKTAKLFESLPGIPKQLGGMKEAPDPRKPAALVLVTGFGGLGLHTLLHVFRSFSHHFQGIVFLSVGVLDSREFKGEGSVEALKDNVEQNLKKYVDFANGQGIPAAYRFSIGTDAVAEAEKICLEAAKEFPLSTFFAGKLIFRHEQWYHSLLHNETAFALQKRLHWAEKIMVVVPARVT